MFSPELREKAEELIGRYPGKRSALLPLLHLVQHQDGYITPDGIAECAELIGLTKAEVAAVATFYTMYKRAPLGEHLVSVCTNFSCKVRGGQAVYDHLAAKLGVGHNQTTADGKFTLEHAECLGNCEGAPVLTVDYLNYEGMTQESAEELIERLAAGERPAPTRGFPPPGVRVVQHRLAGLGPLGAPHEPAEAASGAPTDQARADAGAVPVPEAGPGAEPVAVEPAFAEGQAERREAAKQAVREAGKDPDAVQESAGPRAREFPTTDPDWVPRQPGSTETGAGRGPSQTGPRRPAEQQAPLRSADAEGDAQEGDAEGGAPGAEQGTKEDMRD